MGFKCQPAIGTWICDRCGSEFEEVSAISSHESKMPSRWQRLTLQDDFSDESIDLCHVCVCAVAREVRAHRQALPPPPTDVTEEDTQ